MTLETTLGRWLVEDLDATQPGVQTQLRDGQGEFMLAASPREGVGEIRATSGALVQTGRVAFLPVERPLTAVGILEGRIDLRSLAKGALVPATPQDGFEQELKDISISGDSGLRPGRRARRALPAGQGEGELSPDPRLRHRAGPGQALHAGHPAGRVLSGVR